MRRSTSILLLVTLLFSVGVIVWIFFIKKPDGTTQGVLPTNPFGLSSSRGSNFLNLNTESGKRGVSSPDTTTEVTKGKRELLTQIWDKPVAGYSFVDRSILEQVPSTTASGTASLEQTRATTTSIFFVDRTTGYVYEYLYTTQKIHQISNTLVPGVYDAYFYSNGNYVLLRSFDDTKKVIISSLYSVPSVSNTSDPTALGKITELPVNITSVSVNRLGTEISYLVKTDKGGLLYTLDQKQKETVASLPFSDWGLIYGGNTLYIESKASAYVPGYIMDVYTGEGVISGRTGLVSTPSPSNRLFISSMFSKTGLLTFVFNKITGQTSVLPIKTIASKCTYEQKTDIAVCAVPKDAPQGVRGYPDDWYQGSVSFSDSLYLVSNDVTSDVPIIDISKEGKGDMDITKLVFNSDNSALSFTNKKDGTLWLVAMDILSGDE